MKTEKVIEVFSKEAKPIVSLAALLGIYPGTVKSWGDIVPESWAYRIKYKFKLDVPLEAGDYEDQTKPAKTKTERPGAKNK